jgi:chromosome segregation ATPase
MLSSLKQKNAEMEGQNRLLEDQLDSLGKKMQSAGVEMSELKTRLTELEALGEESAKAKADLETLRLTLEGSEASADAELQNARERLEALEKDKVTILQANETSEAEKNVMAGKLIDLDQELSAFRAEMGKLQEELAKEKNRTAIVEADAELLSKLRKQVETAKNLLTQAAEDNTRLEKERNDLKGRHQSEEEKKNALALQLQSLEGEMKKL